MKRHFALVTIALSTLLFLASNAQAGWSGGFKSCKKTPLIEFDGTIAGALEADPFGNLGTLAFAVDSADPAVGAALDNPNADWTVFAPVNDAFSAIPDDILNPIIADQDLLTDVLLYHVLDRRFDPRRGFRVKEKETLLGQTIFVSRGFPSPDVNQSNIDCQGVRTVNGVVWLIDSVLLPQFLQ